LTVLLIEKMSQDSLKKFFGINRQCGKSNENPKFLKNTQGIHVVNTIYMDEEFNWKLSWV